MLTPRNGDFTSAQVKRLRELLGLSQRVVAARFGVSLNTWSRWEIGTINVHRVRVAGFRQLLARLEKQRVDQDERQPRARSENPDTRFDQSIFISVRVSEDIYRVELDKTAAVFHDLESTQLGSDLERSELLAELTGLIQKLTATLDILHEHTQHSTAFEKLVDTGTLEQLKVRHRDHLKRLFSQHSWSIPFDDALVWAAAEHARALLSESPATRRVQLQRSPDSPRSRHSGLSRTRTKSIT